MNKNDFNFYCLWAKFLLFHDYELIKEDLKYFACTGQQEAIEKWYYFNNFGDSELIDRLINKINKQSPQYYLILANIEKNKHKHIYQKCTKRMAQLIAQTNNITVLECIVKKDKMEDFEIDCNKIEQLTRKLELSKYYKLLNIAKSITINEYKKTGNLSKLSLLIDIMQQQYDLTLNASINAEIKNKKRMLLKEIQQQLPVVANKEMYLQYKYILSKINLQSKSCKKREEAKSILTILANNYKATISDNHHQFEQLPL